MENKRIVKVYESHTNKMFMRVIRFGTKIFKIECQHVNGTINGFNKHCCLSIMDEQGIWRNVIDNRSIGFYFEQYYFLDDNDSRIEAQNRNACNEFVEYIKKVYGDEQ